MHLLMPNDPFFVISKASEGGKWLPVLKSEVDRNLKWKRFTIPVQILCNVDFDRPLRIAFYDFRSAKAPDLIGQVESTLSRLCEASGQILSIRDEKQSQTGSFRVRECTVENRPSFYDYLRGGVQLNLVTAIDFTASNRPPFDPNSLHRVAPGVVNPYEACLRSVGEVLCPYDSDQLFPVLGFGAAFSGQVQHCFPLTFNPAAPCVQGLNGIIGVYKNAITQVQLSGPTLFAPVIRYTSQMADRAFRESRTYTILLIITDGVINDMQDTKDAIVEAGKLPLSIIIVGVGSADFSAMDELDADEVPLVSRAGVKMVRDLVQFVPFSKFARAHYSLLAAEVLEEVPRQLVDWARLVGVRP
jgi:hypothetical protein